MGTLRIDLLGSLRLVVDGRELPAFPTHGSASLFAYLVVHRHRLHPRDVLAGRFRGDRPDASARKWLRTELWRIRSTLQAGEAGLEDCVVTHGHDVGFDTRRDYWLDVEEFERQAAAVRAPAGPRTSEALRLAIELYRGDLLEGYYDEWSTVEQERLKALFLAALERAMLDQHARGEHAGAVALGTRLLSHDPLRESVHRLLMTCHHALGNRAAALRQYEACARMLREEFDVDPMAETLALRELVAGRASPGSVSAAPSAEPAPGGSPGATPEPGPLRPLRRADAELGRARTHLRRAIRRIEGAPPPPPAGA